MMNYIQGFHTYRMLSNVQYEYEVLDHLWKDIEIHDL